MIGNLKKQYSYKGVLKGNITEALGKMQELSIDQKEEALELVDQFLI
jgi:hypothetical protein